MSVLKDYDCCINATSSTMSLVTSIAPQLWHVSKTQLLRLLDGHPRGIPKMFLCLVARQLPGAYRQSHSAGCESYLKGFERLGHRYDEVLADQGYKHDDIIWQPYVGPLLGREAKAL